MGTIEILFIIGIVLGAIIIISFILHDPYLKFNKFIRNTYYFSCFVPTGPFNLLGRFTLKAILFPVWLPLLIIDKIFKLKIFIRHFDEATETIKIDFSDYKKFIKISTIDEALIKQAISSFIKKIDPKEFNYDIKDICIGIARSKDAVYLSLDDKIQFSSFNMLCLYLYNSAPQASPYRVDAVLINENNPKLTYNFFVDSSREKNLIGKMNNKRIFVDFYSDQDADYIYSNSNIEYFKNLNYKKFMADIALLEFKQ